MRGIFDNRANLEALRGALRIKSLPEQAISVFSLYPEKFLWGDLFNFFKGKSDQVITDCVHLLAKLEVLTDPGYHMGPLTDILAQRSLLMKCLQGVDHIKLTLPRLLIVLERLVPLSSDTVAACL